MKPWYVDGMRVYMDLSMTDMAGWPDCLWFMIEQAWADSIGLGVNGREGK